MLFYLINGTIDLFNWDFHLQLYFAELILFMISRRRKGFSWRLAISLVAVACLIFFVPTSFAFLGYQSGINSVVSFFYQIIVFCVHFIVTILLGWFCFDDGLEKFLFLGSVAYLAQHIGYLVFVIIAYYLPIFKENVWLHRIVPTIPIHVACLFLSFHIKKIDFEAASKIKVAVVAAFTVIINVVISVLPRLMQEYFLPYVLMAVVASFALILLVFSLSKEKKASDQLDFLKLVHKEDIKKYSSEIESLEEAKLRMHDLKHFIGSFKEQIPDEYIELITKYLDNMYPTQRTGNQALNIILFNKSEFCKAHDIQFTFIGSGNSLNFIKDEHVYILFANILDNAINAVMNVENKNKRVVSLTIREKMGFVSIISSNYFNQEFEKQKTKENSNKMHGYGLKSIEAIAADYNGFISHNTVDDRFYIEIDIPKSDS